jgi:diacylglycerol kinase
MSSSPLMTESRSCPRRPPWRQRLVETERGLSSGLRADSSFYVYLFLDCTLVAMGSVLGLAAWQWMIVGLVFTGVLAAELFRQSLRVLIQTLPAESGPAGTTVLNLATAAVSVTLLGGGGVVCALFWQRLQDLYQF